jgi:hypothetical protein
MAEGQPRDNKHDGADPHPDDVQSVNWLGDSNGTVYPEKQFTANQMYLTSTGSTSGYMPNAMNVGSSFGFEFDDGYDTFTDSGQYQPIFPVSTFEQTYRAPTQYQECATSISVPQPQLPMQIDYRNPNTLSNSELFWAQYEHGAHIGRDLFPNWKGIKVDDLPPRETLRLIPNEERNLQYMNGRLRPLTNENGEAIRSELTDEVLYNLPFLPCYIDMKFDATTKNIDNWIIMGADLRRDIIPRSVNYNPYHSYDENGVDFFDWRATAAHLQRTYTNKHMKRAEQPHVMGGLLRKFRMDKGRFAEFLTPVTSDTQGNQRRLLLSMENLLFNTRWDIDMERMVMRNSHSQQELPLFTPVKIRPAVRECLQKQYPDERIPTLQDLWDKYPHIQGYDETKHPLFRRAEDHDLQLRRDWETLAIQRGHKRPPITVIKPNYVKERKGTTTKRKEADRQSSEITVFDTEELDDDDDEERPKKRNKNDPADAGSPAKPPPRRTTCVALGGRSKRPTKIPPPLHPTQYRVSQASQPSSYQQTTQTGTFHEALHTPMNLLLQPVSNLNITPDELFYHPPINCVDENGTNGQVILTNCYNALSPTDRHMYRGIQKTQGFKTARQRLLECFRLQEVPALLLQCNDAGLMPSQLQYNGFQHDVSSPSN